MREKALLIAVGVGIVAFLFMTCGLYSENVTLRLENRLLAASNQILSTQPPPDAQCVTWLFRSNLDAARSRMCGNKEKRPGK